MHENLFFFLRQQLRMHQKEKKKKPERRIKVISPTVSGLEAEDERLTVKI